MTLPSSPCKCLVTRGREGARGSWCVDCGRKVWEVDPRPCSGCANFRESLGGAICRRHLMRVTACMLVTYQVADGSCWTAPDSPPACVDCGEAEGGLVKRSGGWVCDPCDAQRADFADLDLEDHEENRRARLAEQLEY